MERVVEESQGTVTEMLKLSGKVGHALVTFIVSQVVSYPLVGIISSPSGATIIKEILQGEETRGIQLIDQIMKVSKNVILGIKLNFCQKDLVLLFSL